MSRDVRSRPPRERASCARSTIHPIARVLRVLPAAVLLSLLARIAAAQAAPERVFVPSHWGVEDGLPQSSVRTIVQTRDGYLWIGTWNGLARFDGIRFTTFHSSNTPALRSSSIISLYEDRAGNLWIGTDGGGLTVRSPAGAFSRRDGSEGVDAKFVQAFCEDTAGRLWIGTDQGLFIQHDGIFSRFSPRDGLTDIDVKRLSPDALGSVWVGGFAYARRMTMQGARLVAAERIHIDRGWFTVDAGGNLWYLDAGGRLVRRSTGHNTHYPLFGERILWLAPVRGAGVAIHTPDRTFILGPNGSPFAVKRLDAGPTDMVEAFFEDREGLYWIGRAGSGLTQLRARFVQTYAGKDGLADDFVNAVFEDSQGTVWVATDKAGVKTFKDGRFRPFSSGPSVSPTASVYALGQRRDGSIEIGLQGGGLHIVSSGLARADVHGGVGTHTSVVAVAEDSLGGNWTGTANDGVQQRTPGGDLKRWTRTNGLSGDQVTGLLAARNGDMWIGTKSGVTRIAAGRPMVYSTRNGLSADDVRGLYEDRDGAVWITTRRGGLNRWKPDGTIFRFATAHGLPTDALTSILEDTEGYFWMGSIEGILRVARHELVDVAEGRRASARSIAFGKEEGLLRSEVDTGGTPASWRATGGDLWFAAGVGLARIDPRTVRGDATPPAVILEEVQVEQKPVALHDLIPVRYDQRRLEFRFTGISFSAPKKLRFKYRLEGLDPDWIDAGDVRYAQYTNMPPGQFRFRVIAVGGNGVWNETGASVGISILPPFWRTWWFYTLAAITLLSVVATGARLFERRKTRARIQAMEQDAAVERERLRIAKDMHDDLGARLTKVSILLGMSDRATGDPARMRSHLREITIATVDAERAMDEIVWAVDPKYDSLKGLLSYVSAYAQEYLEPADVRCRVDIPDSIPDRELTAEERHAMFSVVKESLTNILKYAGASEVHIQAEIRDGGFSLTVMDDGKGFDPAGVAEFRNGLKNMAARMIQIGGTCAIHSAPGAGTTVTITREWA
jgi:ligand-binding sensor domain-containing protein/signal transduction histidine kinase